MNGDTSINYNSNFKPLLTELLSLLKLDKRYIRAEGDYLYFNNNGKEEEILDLAGGMGSILLGHNHPELLNLLGQLYNRRVPAHAQLSIRSGSLLLSEKLNAIIKERSGKNYVSTILNSGTEAVEAAIKHALLNYNCKTRLFYDKIEKEFVNMENYFNKYNVDFNTIYENRKFDSYKSFKTYILNTNRSLIEFYNPKLLASEKSFHGKTMGSLSITSNPIFREPFISSDKTDTIFTDFGLDEINDHLSRNEFYLQLPKINTRGEVSIRTVKFNCITAIIVEPIIGEGGIHVIPRKVLKSLRSIATNYNIPLIFDEIQCGCYRTGEFLASFKMGVFADYYTIGKALGGGLSKISAFIVDKSKYISEFDVLHSSTFADDDISSLIATKALDILDEQKEIIQKKGSYFFKKLQEVKNKYEEIITDIRGDGLMIGISIRDFDLSQCSGFQGLSRSNYFGYVLAGYLLNKKNIRVSVTLSDTRTIRILPSLYVSKSSIDNFIDALDELCKILQCSDFYSLINFILPEDLQNLRSIKNFKIKNVILENDPKVKSNVGFLVHYIDPGSIREYIPSINILDDEAILKLTSILRPFASPVLLGRNCIRNNKDEVVTISFVGLPFTSKMVRDDMRNSMKNLQPYQKMCNDAIEFLYHRGIDKIGLGQYTSIIMQNGKAVTNSNVKITTGNGYTVFTALNVIKSEILYRKSLVNKVAIIGAVGNISTIISYLLVNDCDSLILVGRTEKSKAKLINHATALLKHILIQILKKNGSFSLIEKQFLESKLLFSVKQNGKLLESELIWEMYCDEFKNGSPLSITWNLDDIKDYDIIVVATNDSTAFLESRYFKDDSVICDISVPSNCTNELLKSNSIKVIRGGIVNLPNNEMLHPKGLTLEKGQAFACMVETMLMGFESNDKPFSFGKLLEQQVIDIGLIGRKYGFTYKKNLEVLT